MIASARLLILGAFVALLSAGVGVALLRLSRKSLSLMWLVSLAGLIVAWLGIILARTAIPYRFILIPWQVDTLQPASPVLLLDSASWVYATALTSLGLSIILTAVSRLPGVNWRAWFGVLVLEVISLFAVLAGNTLTLLLSWTILDLAEVFIWQFQAQDSVIRRQVIISFTSRVFGSLVLMAAVLISRQGIVLTFDQLSPEIGAYLILAVGLRLGVVPLQAPFLVDRALRQGIGTMLRMVPSIAAFVLLTRVAEIGLLTHWMPILVGLTLVATFYSGLSWFTAPDELSGRPFWVMLTVSMAVMNAIFRQPFACLAWGIVSVFSGGVMFLSSIRRRGLLPFGVLIWIGVSMLPFTPLWVGVSLYGAIWKSLPPLAASGVSLVLILGQGLLLLGMIRHSIRGYNETAPPERWIWLIYPLGLAVLVLGQYAIGWITQPDITGLSVVEWVASFGGIISAVVLGWAWQKKPDWFFETGIQPGWGSSFWKRFLSLGWAYRALIQVFLILERLWQIFNDTLEGNGGLLWALLWLIMLISVSIQFGRIP